MTLKEQAEIKIAVLSTNISAIKDDFLRGEYEKALKNLEKSTMQTIELCDGIPHAIADDYYKMAIKLVDDAALAVNDIINNQRSK